MEYVMTIILGIFALVGWLSYIRYQRYQFNINNGNTRFNTVLERFGNHKEFLEFLQSKRGLQVLDILTSSKASMKVPILSMISSGIISLAIGMAALLLTLLKDSDFIFATAFMSALGIGLLVAAVAALSLSRRWGIFEENNFSTEPHGLHSLESEQVETHR